jgi:hypothetical protein
MLGDPLPEFAITLQIIRIEQPMENITSPSTRVQGAKELSLEETFSQ